MFCLNCGKKLPNQSKFCPYCGTPVPVLDDEEVLQSEIDMENEERITEEMQSTDDIESADDDSYVEEDDDDSYKDAVPVCPVEQTENVYNLQRYLKNDGYYHFQLAGNPLKFDSSVVMYLQLKRAFSGLRDEAIKKAEKMYRDSEGIEEVLRHITDINFLHYILDECMNFEIRICSNYGMYDLSTDSILRESNFDDGSSIIDNWHRQISKIVNTYNNIRQKAEAERQQRAFNKENRGRVVGGGFGFSGALKGMAQAEAMNMASGALYSMANSIGNSFTNSEEKSQLKDLYKNSQTLETISTAVGIAVDGIINSTGKRFELYDVDYDECQHGLLILNNLANGLIATNNLRNALSQALQSNPYVIDTYRAYLKLCSDETGELTPIAELFGLTEQLEDTKNDLINEGIDSFADSKGNHHIREVIQAVNDGRDAFEVYILNNDYQGIPAEVNFLKSLSNKYNYHRCDQLILDLERIYELFKAHDAKKLNNGFTDTTKIESIQYIGDMIESISIPEGVEVIEKYAFAHCTNLAEVILPKTLKKIETGAFFHCPKLKKLILPDGVEYDSNAYSEKGLVVLPGETTIVGNTDSIRDGNVLYDIPLHSKIYKFFEDNSLLNSTTIYISDDVGGKLISGEYKLPVDFRWSMPRLSERLSKSFKTDVLHPMVLDISLESKNKVADDVLSCSDIAYLSVSPLIIEVGDNFCTNSKVYEVFLNEGLNTIGNGAFFNCQYLRYINIPQTIKKIGDNCFNNCSDLKVVSILSPDVVLGKELFKGSDVVVECLKDSSVHRYCCENGIKYWVYGETNTYERQLEAYNQRQDLLGHRRYQIAGDVSIYDKNTHVEDIKDNIENISDEDGNPVGLMTIKKIFHKKEERLYYRIEQPCKNGDFNIDVLATGIWNNQDNPQGICADGQHTWKIHRWTMLGKKLIGENAYTNSPILYVDAENDIKFVGRKAFSGAQLIAFRAEAVREIWDQAFLGAANLRLVMLGPKLKRIEDYAFAYCPLLTNIYIPPSVTEIGYNLFYGTNVTVSCTQGSAIHNWCLQNQVPINILS